jgi:hypothetical protein
MGQRGDGHIKHARLGVFYVLEGERGSEHVEHAQTGVFYVYEGEGMGQRGANT